MTEKPAHEKVTEVGTQVPPFLVMDGLDRVSALQPQVRSIIHIEG